MFFFYEYSKKHFILSEFCTAVKAIQNWLKIKQGALIRFTHNVSISTTKE